MKVKHYMLPLLFAFVFASCGINNYSSNESSAVSMPASSSVTEEVGSMPDLPESSEIGQIDTTESGDISQYERGKIYDVTQQFLSGELTAEGVHIYYEGSEPRLGLFEDKNAEPESFAQLSGRTFSIKTSGGNTAVIAYDRYGNAMSAAVYDSTLQPLSFANFVLSEAQLPQGDSIVESKVVTVIFSDDLQSMYYIKNVDMTNILCRCDANFNGEQQLLCLSAPFSKDNPSDIELVAMLDDTHIFIKGSYPIGDEYKKCYGTLDISSGSITAQDEQRELVEESFGGGAVVYDMSAEFGETASGTAEIYIGSEVRDMHFKQANESQNVTVSQSGRYCVTINDCYIEKVFSSTEIRVYDTEKSAMLQEYFISTEDADYITVNNIDERSNSVILSTSKGDNERTLLIKY